MRVISLGRVAASRALALACALVLAAGPIQAEIGPETLLISVGETIGSGSTEIAAFGPGFGDLMIVDILALLEAEPQFGDCDIALLEWRRRGDVLGERDLQLSGLVDPASITVGNAPPPEPSVLIEGSLTDEGGTVSWTIEMRERASGTVLATSTGSVPGAEIFEQSAQVARAMLEAACPAPGGGWTASGGGARIVITGHVERIDVPFQLQGKFPGAAVAFEFVPVGALGGSVSYTFAGSASGSGAGDFSMSPQPDGTVLIETNTNGCVDGIPNSCKTNSEKITLTPDAN